MCTRDTLKMKLKKNELKKWRESYTPWGKHRVVTEGLELNIHFDEKNWVKNIGGKWDDSNETWWIPSGELTKPVDSSFPHTLMSSVSNVDQVLAPAANVLEWLNNNKMINRTYGDVDIEMVEEECKNLTSYGNDVVSEYTMANDTKSHQSRPITVKIEWWHDLGCVRFTSDIPLSNILPSIDTNQCWDDKIMWVNSLKARDIWEELIESGLDVKSHYSARSKAITSP